MYLIQMETVNPEPPKSMSPSETREEPDELQIPEAIETELLLMKKMKVSPHIHQSQKKNDPSDHQRD